MRFARLADARNAVFCRTKGALEDGWGRSAARGFRKHVRLASDHARIGPRCSCRFRRRFPNLKCSVFEGHLARIFGFTSSTFRFGGKVLESLPPKLRFRILNFQIFAGQSFVFASSTFSFQKSGGRVFYLLNGMCLSQPSSLYQRCFLFPLLKGPGFPMFPSRIPRKLSHIRRISQGQVFSHSEGSRSRLQNK